MAAALIAAIAATLGLAVGRLWDGRSEAARWRRDKTTAAYQRMAEAFRTNVERIRTIALADPADKSFPDLVRQARSDSEWDDAYAGVWLQGSPAVVDAVTTLDLAVTELLYAAQDCRHRIEDWYRIRLPAREAFEEFLRAARKDLGLRETAKTYFPEFGRQVPAAEPEAASLTETRSSRGTLEWPVGWMKWPGR